MTWLQRALVWLALVAMALAGARAVATAGAWVEQQDRNELKACFELADRCARYDGRWIPEPRWPML